MTDKSTEVNYNMKKHIEKIKSIGISTKKRDEKRVAWNLFNLGGVCAVSSYRRIICFSR